MKKILLYLYKMLFPLGVCFFFLYFLPKLLFFFLPFTLGAIIAFCLNPLISFLQKRFPFFKKKQISLVLTLAIFALFFYLCFCLMQLGLPMIKQRISHLPLEIQDLKGQLEKAIEENLPYFPPSIQNLLSDLPGTLDSLGRTMMNKWTSPALQFSLHVVSGLPELFLYLIITILSALCFSQEGAMLLSILHRNIPEQFGKYMQLLKEDGKKILKGYVWAQIQIMFCVFILLSVGFSLLRVELAIPLAFLTAFLDALPVFGVGFIMWPWMALILLKGKFLLFLALLLIYVLSQMIRQILQPKIIGDAVGLPPLLALVFLFLGYKLYGISGMVLALPVGMLLVRFYHYGAFSGFFSAGKALGQMLLDYAGVKKDEEV